MALLHALVRLRKELDFRLLALSVDHGLRPEARQEVLLVQSFCEEQQVEFQGLQLHLSKTPNLQEVARDARYAALWNATRSALGQGAFLATAHHKQDKAETVLLRILRGTSLAGLGVLKARESQLLRPAIHADKLDVLAHLKRHAVRYADDPSNHDRQFLRVRIRNELMPLLSGLSAGVVDHLVALADEAARGDAAIGLNREQREQLRNALREPKSAIDLRLPAGLRLWREKP